MAVQVGMPACPCPRRRSAPAAGDTDVESGQSPKRVKTSCMPQWGDWMGAWKAAAGQVDEEAARIDRQNAAFGGETSARLKDLNVLLIGCCGVGVECAKNLILSNIGGIVVWDPRPVAIEDLGANFYLTQESCGKPRAEMCLRDLKSLNPYCKVDVSNETAEWLPKYLEEANVLSTGRPFSVVVVTVLLPGPLLIALNQAARKKGIAFIMGVNQGPTSSIFSDFGPQHVISDPDGEPTQMLAVAGIEVLNTSNILKVEGTKDGEEVVVVTLSANHNLEDGATVSLDDLRGNLSKYNGKQFKVNRVAVVSPVDAKVSLEELSVKELLKSATSLLVETFSKQYDHYKSEFEKSGAEGKFKTREITLFNRLCLVFEEGKGPWKSYKSGGLINQVKPPATKEYKSLSETLEKLPNPQMLNQEAWVQGDGIWVHLAIATALEFFEAKKAWPKVLDMADAEEFVKIATALSKKREDIKEACWLQKVEFGFPSGEPIENIAAVEQKLRRFSLLFATELTGFSAFLGGAVAQEVIKKTGKFTPIEQWLHHDDPGLVRADLAQATVPSPSRYMYQEMVLGPEFMQKIRAQNIFLVGCGALGCEYLKGLCLMGACTQGKLWVTDMDRIEVSNLSRQFLFRQPDVGSAKSVSAARVVKGWNPELNVVAWEKRVGTDTEDWFNDNFWESLDLCWNALDNVIARRYTDSCCTWYGKPLLESGTLGTKSNSDVFLPELTKCYSDGVETDDNENQIAMCTLRSFPFLPLHCIEFAKQAYFSDYFEFAPTQYETFRKDQVGFFEQVESMGEAEQLKAMQMIMEFVELQKGGQVDFNACLRVAFQRYIRDFQTSIKDLVHTCDNMEKTSGKPFWTGTKRRPRSAPWNPDAPDAAALEYLYATANMYAFIWNCPYSRDRAEFEKVVKSLRLVEPEWTPKAGGTVETNENENETPAVDAGELENLKGQLYGIDTSSLLAANAHDFEKDDDTNFHIDFMTIATNLRSWNYDIKASQRSTVKVTAGKIIPALATTTAMICGLVDIEFMKIVLGLHKKGENPSDAFFNANVNLATGSTAFNAFNPEKPIKKESQIGTMSTFCCWDKIEVDGELSLKDLVKHLEDKYEVHVEAIYPAGNDKMLVYRSEDLEMQNWKIELTDSSVVVEPAERVYQQWPQLRMAAQMLGRMAPGPARKNFENQVNTCKKSLDSVKESFTRRYTGPVSAAFVEICRPKGDSPEDEEKQKYFDKVFAVRKYLAFSANMKNRQGDDAELPKIKYIFRR